MALWQFKVSSGETLTREAVCPGNSVYLLEPKGLGLPLVDGAALMDSGKDDLFLLYTQAKEKLSQFQRAKRAPERDRLKEEARPIIATFLEHPDAEKYFIAASDAKMMPKREYEDQDKFPEWAMLAARYNISVDGYEDGCEIIERLCKEPASKANFPEIGVLKGEEYGLPGYYMKPIDKTDLKLMVIGKIINQVQHKKGKGQGQHTCAYMGYDGQDQIDSEIFSPDIQTYILCKQKGVEPSNDDPVVGKVTAWRGTYKDHMGDEKKGHLLQ